MIGLLRRLPEKAVGLTLENLHLGAGNSILQRFGLRQMIAARRIVVADEDQRRTFHVAEPVRGFPIVTRDDQMNVLRQFCVSRPGELKECLDFVRMFLAIVVGEKRAGNRRRLLGGNR